MAYVPVLRASKPLTFSVSRRHTNRIDNGLLLRADLHLCSTACSSVRRRGTKVILRIVSDDDYASLVRKPIACQLADNRTPPIGGACNRF